MTIWTRLNPAVPRHWLFALAGLLWTAVGSLLCIRAITWLSVFSLETELLVEFFGAALAPIGYLVLFSKVVQKNIDRILGLPERACAFAFAAWKGYLMIAFMIAIGLALRNSGLPKFYLALPYTAMGGVLLIGSTRFYREFIAISRQKI